ncbi:hypothetical protein UFOVP1462_24 [uncultured Caudovirales phage]|uniref:Uncharacterized protein n=1 Tax=uncultured Caudovirales phage TaxID=2100421 RepID=A0A6J5Q0Z8_9CAUD|nr:hypothetical protein UFOVP1013_24 [uncultured Caudovirales phage]CAB4202858.1 hypothetical protein UFOVP1364_41 [uncultured Caudovirales phage]CAB4214226.1 hypothetical protein UFOVP1462_24 [uncultured Caudovirales phage]CAB5228752.1 hypothetical protein UFOVP1550_33 [uncultured Caudovirales phage]
MPTTSEQVKAQIEFDGRRLWVSDNGDVTCEEHAGMYLHCAIEAKPKAKSHRTPLGTWDAFSMRDLGALPCSVCVDWMTLEIK